MKIDKIFVINLKEREDRRKEIENELAKQGITNYEIIEGIKATDDDCIRWCDTYIPRIQNINPYKLGSLGCLMSHLSVMNIAIERNYERILVLEDDTIFLQDYQKLFTYISEYDGNIDLLYLSGSHHIKPKKVTEHICRVYKTIALVSYICNRKVMEYIVKKLPGYPEEVDDFFWKHIQKNPNFDCFVTIPHITKQRPSFSNITQRFETYKMSDRLLP